MQVGKFFRGSLADFEKLWDNAHKGFTIPLPVRPSLTPPLDSDSNPQGCEEILDVARSDGRIDHESLDDFLEDSPKAQCSYGSGLMAAIGGQDFPFKKRLWWNDGANGSPPTTGHFEFAFELSTDQINKKAFGGRIKSVESRSIVPIKVQTYPTDERIFAKLFFGSDRRGTFSEAFPELYTAVSDIGYVDITTAQHLLETRPSQGVRSLSILGFGLPLAQISTWGTALLIGVQLYFLLHLRELISKIDSDAEGWNVAWIGIYRAKLSAALVLASACLLPIGAVLCTAIRTAEVGGSRLLVNSEWTILVASTIIGLVSGWKLMQLRGQVILNQLTAEPAEQTQTSSQEVGQTSEPAD